jgi:hypothetical protein
VRGAELTLTDLTTGSATTMTANAQGQFFTRGLEGRLQIEATALIGSTRVSGRTECVLLPPATFCGITLAETATPPAALCTDTCRYAGDGQCDDGGPGADFSLCRIGTDCADCGSRNASVVRDRPYDGIDALCDDSCATARDGECDDGSKGAICAICGVGTDCSDCGARLL